MWDLPGSGLKPVSPAFAGRFLTTAPPGKSPPYLYWNTLQRFKLKKWFLVFMGIIDTQKNLLWNQVETEWARSTYSTFLFAPLPSVLQKPAVTSRDISGIRPQSSCCSEGCQGLVLSAASVMHGVSRPPDSARPPATAARGCKCWERKRSVKGPNSASWAASLPLQPTIHLALDSGTFVGGSGGLSVTEVEKALWRQYWRALGLCLDSFGGLIFLLWK